MATELAIARAYRIAKSARSLPLLLDVLALCPLAPAIRTGYELAAVDRLTAGGMPLPEARAVVGVAA